MKIAVCVKQVPLGNNEGMDKETGNVLRTGKSIINSYDLVALEFAMRVKEKVGASVDAFTMGPSKASEVLITCFGYGVDEGYLISDKAFAGADVLATSYTLARAIQSVGHYDLILCGRQTTDGDTGHVSGAVSQWMEYPYFNGVLDILSVTAESVNILQHLDTEMMEWNISYPCVLAIEKGKIIPRIPTLKAKLASKKKKISIISKSDIKEENNSYFGSKGSATKVRKIYTPDQERPCEELIYDAETALVSICQLLKEKRRM